MARGKKRKTKRKIVPYYGKKEKSVLQVEKKKIKLLVR